MSAWLGSQDDQVNEKYKRLYCVPLLCLGFVKAEQHDVEGRDVLHYRITAKGRKALAKAVDAEQARQMTKDA